MTICPCSFVFLVRKFVGHKRCIGIQMEKSMQDKYVFSSTHLHCCWCSLVKIFNIDAIKICHVSYHLSRNNALSLICKLILTKNRLVKWNNKERLARAPCSKKQLYIDFKSAQIDESRCSHCLLLLRKWLKSCPSVKLSKKLKRKKRLRAQTNWEFAKKNSFTKSIPLISMRVDKIRGEIIGYQTVQV